MKYENGYFDEILPMEELFDLRIDPAQKHNAAGNAVYQQTQAALAAQLTAQMQYTADPMLNGSIPFGPGALVNYPDSYSPAEKVFLKSVDELL